MVGEKAYINVLISLFFILKPFLRKKDKWDIIFHPMPCFPSVFSSIVSIASTLSLSHSLSFLFCAGQIPDMNAFSLFLSPFSSIPMKWVRLGSQVGTTLHIFLNFLLVYLYWVRGWVERYGVLQRHINRWFYLTTAQLIILRGQLDAKILNIILM